MAVKMDHPGHVLVGEWPTIGKRAIKESLNDGVTRLAAMLTYYALMSLFPALIFVVALLALVGQEAITRTLLDLVAEIAPGEAVETVREPLENLVASRGQAGTFLSIGIIVSIWSASGFVAAFMWAANRVYEVDDRSFLRKLPRQVILAIGLLVALALLAVVVVLTGPVAQALGDFIGLGEAAVTAYAILRWPLLFVIATLLFSVLYYFAPNVQQPKFRWITVGGLLGVVLWLVATIGFTIYVNTFGNYSATYGALAGIIVFIFWLWIFALSLLGGLEFNVELEKRREELAGESPGDSPQLPEQERREESDEEAA